MACAMTYLFELHTHDGYVLHVSRHKKLLPGFTPISVSRANKPEICNDRCCRREAILLYPNSVLVTIQKFPVDVPIMGSIHCERNDP
eukprot:scaffold2987_cov170-Amphora_coffeaeformis.AAC.33